MGAVLTGLRELLAGDMPLIAVSFGDDDAAGSAERARAAGVDVAELRVDWYSCFEPEHVLRQVRAFQAMPTLATIRSNAEGGYWAGTEPERLRLFESMLPEVDAVDVELSATEILPAVVAAAKEHQRVVIVSHHDFAATPEPDRLAGIAEAAKAQGADYVKVSTMANGPADLRVLAAFCLQYRKMGLIVIGMGAGGSASRVFFPALGSRLTYSAIGGRSAPGQLPFADTARLLRTFYPGYPR